MAKIAQIEPPLKINATSARTPTIEVFVRQELTTGGATEVWPDAGQRHPSGS